MKQVSTRRCDAYICHKLSSIFAVGLLFCLISVLAIGLTCSAQQKHACSGGSMQNPADCGIKITMNPPLKEENVFWVPNEVTVDVPLHLHPTIIVLQSEPTGTGIAEYEDEIKVVAEMKRFKKVGDYARFQTEVKSCPYGDTLQIYISTRDLQQPIGVYISPFECKQRASK
jgi:hypothetical protein